MNRNGSAHRTAVRVYDRGPLYDGTEAVQFLSELGVKISRRTLEEDRVSGRSRFPYYKLGPGPKARVYYSQRDLLEVIESGRVEPQQVQG